MSNENDRNAAIARTWEDQIAAAKRGDMAAVDEARSRRFAITGPVSIQSYGNRDSTISNLTIRGLPPGTTAIHRMADQNCSISDVEIDYAPGRERSEDDKRK